MPNFAICFTITRKTNTCDFRTVTPTTKIQEKAHIFCLSPKTIYFKGVVRAEDIFQAEELLLREIQAQISEYISMSL